MMPLLVCLALSVHPFVYSRRKPCRTLHFWFVNKIRPRYFWGGSIQVLSDIDDVPEPSTIALMGMAMPSMFGYGMRRRLSKAT